MKFHQYLFLFSCFFSAIVVSQNKAESKIITVEDSIAKSLTKGYKLSRNYKYKEGVQIIISAIEFANKLKNDSLVGKGYNALAIINADLGNDTTALKSLRKAKKLLLKAKNYGYLGITYNNMAYVFYENRKDIDSSVYYLKKAVTAHKNSKNTWSLALTYYNLGEMLEKKNQLDKSLNVLDSALYYSKKVNRIYSLCYTYQAYAEVYYKKKENSKSLNYLNRSLKIAEKEKYNDILVKLYKLKSTLLKEAKNYKSSLENIEKHNQILKILNEKEKLRTLNEISAKFELKEREKELDKVISDNKTKDTRLRNSKIFIFLIAGLLIIAALSTLLLYKNNRLKKENNNLLIIKNKELKELQLQTELNFLKTQIQPHFFFNTLNNLYALIIEKSDKAKDVVLKLSELMEYSLYGVSNKNVPILNEINNIQNYLELEELRYSEKIYSTLNIEGELDNLKVPPLLYVTFIENCFKHGNVNGENFNLLISFKNNNDKDLIFTVKNTINEGMFIDLNKPKGIGIENVKRRLKILFKDDFTLKVTIENNMFCVYLRTPVEF